MTDQPGEPRRRPGPAQIVGFTSPADGSGRTNIVANLAWILAAAGQRVLVIDGGSKAPLVRHYLKPFLLAGLPLEALRGDRAGAGATVGGGGRGLPSGAPGPAELPAGIRRLLADPVRRYQLPAGAGRIDVVEPVGPDTPEAGLAEGAGEPGAVARMREWLRAAPYSFVLIDGSTASADATAGQLAELCDVVAVCFTVQRGRIAAAARLAGKIADQAPVTIDILAVPTQFDDRDRRSAELSRGTILDAFARPLSARGRPGGTVRQAGATRAGADPDIASRILEIPYHPFNAYDEVLAVLVDEPGAPGTLLAAYLRVAGVLLGGPVDAPVWISAQVRARYRRQVGLEDGTAETIYLGYPPRLRPWADWLRGQLEQTGATVLTLPRSRPPESRPPESTPPGAGPDPPAPAIVPAEHRSAVVVVTGTGLDPAVTADLARLDGLTAASGGEPLDVVTVRVPGPPDDPAADDRAADDLPGDEPAGDDPITDRPAGDAPAAPGATRTVDLRRRDGDHARAALLGHLGLIGLPAADDDTGAARYPGTRPDLPWYSNVAPRNDNFVGRDHELDQVRDRLLTGHPGSRPATCAIRGDAGVGKSEIAREYAHRFGFDYDLVWWIDGQDRTTVRAGLAALAQELGRTSPQDAPTAALQALAGDTPTPRWLLIYDNSDDPAALADLLPDGGTGHVLITTRDLSRQPVGGTVIAAFTLAESTELLRRRVPGLPVADAELVAADAGRLPLALRLAAAWIRECATWLQAGGSSVTGSASWAAAELRARLAAERGDTPDGTQGPDGKQGPDGSAGTAAAGSASATLARMLAVSVRSLADSDQGAPAVQVAQLCAFLAPEGVSLRLLRSAAMRAQLALAQDGRGSEIADDISALDRVLWTGVRFGLFDVEWGQAAGLHIHRVVQAVLRERLTAEEQARLRHRAAVGLAGYAPSDVDAKLDLRRADLAELQRHLVPSGALDDDDPLVRRWIVGQARYTFLEGTPEDWRAAARANARLLRRWSPPGTEPDDLWLQLGYQQANLLRELGRTREALALDELVLTEQRRTLGRRHPRTLRTARGRGADLRRLGRFEDALAEDQTSWRQLGEVLGEDHPDTMRAANNLATSYFLAGYLAQALELEEANAARRRRLFGENHPDAWRSGYGIGTCLRELGRLGRARRALTAAAQRVADGRPVAHFDVLRVQRSLAVTERRLDPTSAAAKDRDGKVLVTYREVLGDDHPATRACRLSLAADHHAIGDSATAVTLARRCLAEYLADLTEDHPFTAVCQVDLGIFLRGADELEESVRMSAAGLATLTMRVGDMHPWTIAAAVDHACGLAASGRFAEAIEICEQARQDGLELLGARHPHTVTAAADLAVMRAVSGAGTGRPAGSATWRDIDLEVPAT